MPEGRRVRVAPLADLPPGTMVSVTVDEHAVLLVNLEGSVRAMQATCPHEEADLSEGEILGDSVACWLHGSRFSILTGEVIDPPAQHPLATYPAHVEDGWISLEVPAAGLEVNRDLA